MITTKRERAQHQNDRASFVVTQENLCPMLKSPISINENLGSDIYVYVDIGLKEPVVARKFGKSEHCSGDDKSFSHKGERFHLFDQAGRLMSKQ